MAQKFQLILQERVNLTSGTEHFKFVCDDPTIIYKPGQFISLHIEKDGTEYRRNYSIANPPGSDNVMELAMAYVPGGLASTLLANLKPGDKVQASGPYGQFILKDEILPQRYVLIGTGTGITPYRSMLPQLGQLLESSSLEVVILQGVRTPQDLLYANEFKAFAAKYANAKFYACHSRQLSDEPKEHELLGYVQHHLEKLDLGKAGDIAYLCGNPHMVDEAFEKLQALGLERSVIRREKYISSKA